MSDNRRAGRVLQGAHYPHDVLAGAVVGVGITCVFVVIATPWAAELMPRGVTGDRDHSAR